MNVLTKHAKKIVSFSLALVAILVFCFGSLAAPRTTIKQYQGFSCIGDSTASGYGIANLNYNDLSKGTSGGGWGWGWNQNAPKAHFGVADNAFPGIIRDEVGADYYSMTCVGMRLAEALWVLGGYDEIDREAMETYHRATNASDRLNSIIYMHDTKEGIDHICKSSLIAIEIGSNDVFTYPKRLATVDGELDYTLFLEELIKGYATYLELYPKLIERIFELNPNCDIVLISNYNPYKNFTFVEGGSNSVGSIIDLYTALMNSNLKSFAKKYGVKYADVTEVGNEFEALAISDEDFINRFSNMDNHPSQDGHNIIAQRVLEQIDPEEQTLSAPQSGINRVEINDNDMGEFIIRQKNLGYTIKTLDGYYLNFDEDSGTITYSRDDSTVWLYSENGFHKTSVGLNIIIPTLTTYYIGCNENGELVITETKSPTAVYAKN